MNSRHVPINQDLPREIVDMTILLLPKLDLTDLERLILFTELEVQYRQETGEITDED